MFLPPLESWQNGHGTAESRIVSFWNPPDAASEHNALDISNAEGSPIYASYTGQVVSVNDAEDTPECKQWFSTCARDECSNADNPGKPAGCNRYGGKALRIKDSNGRIHDYTHLSKILVRVGERVEKCKKIAEMGSTGNAHGSPHLHYAVYSTTFPGPTVNPLIFLNSQAPAASMEQHPQQQANTVQRVSQMKKTTSFSQTNQAFKRHWWKFIILDALFLASAFIFFIYARLRIKAYFALISTYTTQIATVEQLIAQNSASSMGQVQELLDILEASCKPGEIIHFFHSPIGYICIMVHIPGSALQPCIKKQAIVCN